MSQPNDDTILTYRPAVGDAELAQIRQVLDSRWLGSGLQTREFERRLAEIVQARHVVAVSSGTAALQLALATLDLAPGDEVLVPSLTFCGSIQAILAAGGTPVFCEVNPTDLCLSLDDAAARATSRTRAVMPVHYAGQPCDLQAINALSQARGWKVIEDAAHAFGSTYQGQPIGSLTDACCFSFDPLKNITCGDGGAVATHNDALAERVRLQRQLGIDRDSFTRAGRPQLWRYAVSDRGHRMHLNNLAAAVGLAQLDRWTEFRDRKRELVRSYDRAFHGCPLVLPQTRSLSEIFPFAYVARILGGHRDELIEHLAQRKIVAMVQFIPNHLQSAFREFASPLPVTEQLFSEIISLPLFFEMTENQQRRVIGAVHEFLEGVERSAPVTRAA